MVVALLTSGLSLTVGGSDPAGAAAVTTWVSATTAGTLPNGVSFQPSISGDGNLVAFWGSSSDLVSGDTNSRDDVFVRDVAAGTIERVSVASGGGQANGSSGNGVISADGSAVAFNSAATNLVSGDSNGRSDVFVRDLTAGTTELISVSTAGVQSNQNATDAIAISGDGRYVAFISLASTLVTGDVNNKRDAFVRDRQTGTTTRVSVDSTGAEGNNQTDTVAMSADGRFVSFHSSASNLVSGDSNGQFDTFVHELSTGQTERVSVNNAGTQGNGGSDRFFHPSVSTDGRYITFASDASNLVTGDTNASTDIFVRDRQTGTTERVSLNSAGQQANSDSIQSTISGDGRYVGFISYATNLLTSDTNGVEDVLIRDRQAGLTWRASVDSAGQPADDWSQEPALSQDGSKVAFYTGAGLDPADTNAAEDVYVRGVEPPPKWLSPDTREMIGQRYSDRHVADPVSVVTGNLYEADRDMSFPAWGMDFTRMYNSRADFSTDLGVGWSHSFSALVDEISSTEANVRLPDGRTVAFARPVSIDPWTSTTEPTWTLTGDATAGWQLNFPERASWTFTGAGQLTTLESGDGQAVDLSYTSGHLDTAVHRRGSTPSGFAYTFEDIDADGLIDSVSASDGRTVNIEHDSSGSLVSVTAAHLASEVSYGVTDYTTDADGRPLSVSIRDASQSPGTGRVTLSNTFDTDGRVLTQTTAEGDLTTFDYSDPTDPGHTEVTFDHSGDALAYDFDHLGQVTAVTDPQDQTASYAYADGRPSTTTGRLGAESQTVYDSAGRVASVSIPDPDTGAPGWGTETYTYVGGSSGNDPRIETYTNAENEVTRYTYDGSELNPSTVTVGYGTPDAQTTTYDVEDELIMSIEDGDGVLTCNDYDTTGLIIATRTALDTVTDCDDNDTDTDLWSTTTYTYTAQGLLESERAPDQQPSGPTTSYEYFGTGAIKRLTHPDSTHIDYTYHPDGSLASQTDELGNVTTHDKAWNQPAIDCGTAGEGCAIKSITTPLDGLTTRTTQDVYDRSGDLREHREPDGSGGWNTTTHTYGALGRLLYSVDPTGVQTSYDYDDDGNITEVAQGWTIDLSYATSTTYDKLGRITSVTQPQDDTDRVTTTYTYDKLGRNLTTTVAGGSPAERVDTTSYNAAGLTSTTGTARPDLGTGEATEVTTIYTSGGRPACTRTLIDRDGSGDPIYAWQATDYDPAGRPIHTRTSRDNVSGCDDNPTDTSHWSTTALGYTQAGATSWSQTAGQYEAVPDPGDPDHPNYRTSYAYDDNGRLITSTTPDPSDPGNGTVTSTQCWTDRGELARSEDGAGNVTADSYFDAPNLVRTVTDPRGMPTSPSDPCSTTPLDATTGTVNYGYDLNSHRTSRTSFDNNTPAAPIVETWTYDSAGRQLNHLSEAASTYTTYAIAYGRLISTTVETGDPSDPADPAGSSLRTTETQLWPSGRTGQVTDTRYDPLNAVIDSYLTQTHYDQAGRPSQIEGTYTDSGGSTNEAIAYTRDPAGHVTQVTYSDTSTASFTWDLGGRRRSETLPDGSQRRYTFDSQSNQTLVELNTPGGWQLIADTDYDANKQPTGETLIDGDGGDRNWQRDPATGRLSQFQEHRTDPSGGPNQADATWSATWDPTGRLASDCYTDSITTCGSGDQNRSYTYDPAGQLINVDVTNPASDDVTNRTYAYGNRGERLQATATHNNSGSPFSDITDYTYDDGLHLQTSTLNSGTPNSYSWDLAGRRRTVIDPSGASHLIDYDVRGLTIGLGIDTYDPVRYPSVEYGYWDYSGSTAMAQPLLVADGATLVRIDRGAAVAALASTTGLPESSLGVDLSGSIAVSVDASGVDLNSYTPEGVAASAAGPLGYRAELSGFAGTYFLRARWYDPTALGFTTPDPLDGVDGTPTVASAYAYANNDPVNLADPTGRRPSEAELSSPAKPSTINFWFPVDEGHRWLGEIQVAGFIPQAQTSMTPLGGPGPRFYKGDNRSFTQPGTFIDPARNRFFARIDFSTGMGFAQVNPTCRATTSGFWVGGSCHSALPLRYAAFDGNNPFDDYYHHNYVVMQRSAETYRFKWSVAQADDGFAQDLLRPRADGNLDFKFVEGGRAVSPSWSGDCFPSIEVMRVHDGTTSVIGRVSAVGAEAMIGGVTNFYNFVGKC